MSNIALCNVLLLAFAFFCTWTAFVSVFNAQEYILESLKLEDRNYTGDGHISLCITFGISAVVFWIAPSVINVIKLRPTFVIGSVGNLLFIAQFLYPLTWMLYLSSFISGIMGALIWTAQGSFLTLNSTNETITRNSGILWAIIQFGYVVGNIYVFFIIKGNIVTKVERYWLFGFMTGMCCLSTVIMLLLKKPQHGKEIKIEAKKVFIKTLKLFITRDMLILSVTFFYSGLYLSFYTGVYSSAMAFTKKFNWKETEMVSISGFLIGLGEVVCGTMIGLLGQITTNWKRYPIVIIGFILNITTFTLILLNLPNFSANRPTEDEAIIQCNVVVGFICSFMLGFADSCFITQIYGTLGSIFAKESGPAFAIFKFIQSTSCAIAFFYTSADIGLYVVLSILYVFSIAGTICFCIVEFNPTYQYSEDSTDELDNDNKE